MPDAAGNAPVTQQQAFVNDLGAVDPVADA